MTIAVHQNGFPALQEIIFGFYVKTFQASVFQHFFFGHPGHIVHRLFAADDTRWFVYTVQ